MPPRLTQPLIRRLCKHLHQANNHAQRSSSKVAHGRPPAATRSHVKSIGTSGIRLNAGLRAKLEIWHRFITREEQSRTLIALGLPKMAIDEDVKTLFEESGYPVDRVVMRYDPMTGHNSTYCYIILPTTASLPAAMADLNDAPLFGCRLIIFKPDHSSEFYKSDKKYSLRRGWYASSLATVEQVRSRDPQLTYPTDVFAPVREARRLAFDNMPDPTSCGHAEVQLALYRLFHNLNVLAMSKPINYVSQDKTMSGWVMHIDFATRQEAETAQTFDGCSIGGRRVFISPTKPPLKYTTSWDNVRGGGHNQTGRDQGSAVGTNFEAMQEEVYRTWILGQHDRKLWVPTHTYRKDDGKKP